LRPALAEDATGVARLFAVNVVQDVSVNVWTQLLDGGFVVRGDCVLKVVSDLPILFPNTNFREDCTENHTINQ
jgi:hypothetical protein